MRGDSSTIKTPYVPIILQKLSLKIYMYNKRLNIIYSVIITLNNHSNFNEIDF